MDFEVQIKTWINEDEKRCKALDIASKLKLNDWCLAAGFVRNLVWDKVHGKSDLTPLNDIDLIYFNKSETDEKIDGDYESYLKSISDFPWSVKKLSSYAC